MNGRKMRRFEDRADPTSLIETSLQLKMRSLKELGQTLLHEIEALEKVIIPSQAEIERGINMKEAVQCFEIYLIRFALNITSGNQVRAAKLLGVGGTTLSEKIKRYRLRP